MDRNRVSGWRLTACLMVALRKESVDRNCSSGLFGVDTLSSLSARRAWIEIAVIRRAVWAYYVALRKESVDRNSTRLASSRAFTSRSPQGERG